MPIKLLIVGGAAAGMSAAARARRLGEDSEIIVFERGGFVSFANCGFPYHIGGAVKDRSSLLLQTPESLRESLNLDVRIRQEVSAILPKLKKLRVRDLIKNTEYEESYDKLILCPGATPLRPSIPGICHPKIFMLRSIDDMDRIKSEIDAGGARKAVIVGAGYIGVELAENLAAREIKVEVVDIRSQILPPFDFEMARELEQHIESKGVKLHLGTAAAGFRDENGRLAVELQNAAAIEADFAILAAGIRPDSSLAKSAGIATGGKGGIKVDSFLRTSDPDIYAAGDAVEVFDEKTGLHAQIPLGGPANKQGRIAADNVFGRKSLFNCALGTTILKVFKMCGACTGASEKILRSTGRKYAKVYLHPSNHVSYYPGSASIHLKLLFSPEDGKLLGAQAVGFEGVDKRIDVIATAIRAGMTVYDLESLELSYAPPFGAAKDAVNMAGFVAANLLRGDIECWYPEDFPEKTKNGVIIDVRSPDMYEGRHIAGAVNIPLLKLRASIARIPRDRDVFLYCRVGFTSYLAYRILKQNGFGKNFALKTLSGGITTFHLFHGGESCASGGKKTDVSPSIYPL